MSLCDTIQTLSGIGPKRAEALNNKGITQIKDLIYYFPIRYEDRSHRGSFETPSKDPVTIKAIIHKRPVLRRIKHNFSMLVLQVEEMTADDRLIKGTIVWYNQPYLLRQFKKDAVYYFYGRIVQKNGQTQMQNPHFAVQAQAKAFFQIEPIYGKIENFPQATLRKSIACALEKPLKDFLPKCICEKYHLMPLKEALVEIHQPKKQGSLEKSTERLKFNEALKINLGIQSERYKEATSTIHLSHFEMMRRLVKSLPYTLTDAQQQVLQEIQADLKTGKMMNRLVQGDVGSGKTVIAIACACLMASNGYQTAYMAPTEILAEQHAKNFEALLRPFNIKTVLLTGSLKTKARRTTLKKIEEGEAMVIIGTHALIQDKVQYYNLGLVITDEQHRFGVKQRSRLTHKGTTPHTLVMSATPIPRTLSLILYGDLNVSYIDTLPQGRKPIKTYFYREKTLPKVLDFVKGEVQKGRQAFIICPFIEESEGLNTVNDTQRVYQTVNTYYQKKLKVAVLTGKMPADQRKKMVEAFNQGAIQILIATSIIEVGIDVPNVSAMVIMSAERFGLSQLHQLRGRVGRGQHQSYCFLVSETTSESALERLEVVVNNTDGKKIAEADYQLRGPGDYFGFNQHGYPSTQLLNPYEDLALLKQTRQVAAEIFESGESEMMQCKAFLLDEFEHDITEISFT